MLQAFGDLLHHEPYLAHVSWTYYAAEGNSKLLLHFLFQSFSLPFLP